MEKLTGKAGTTMATRGSGDWQAVLAHHDSEIKNLGQRMGGVESEVKKLTHDLHSGFNSLDGKLGSIAAAMAARPTFDFHKSVGTVLSLAVLFSMVVGGIIWVTQSQFSGIVAEQRGTNATFAKMLEKHEDRLDRHGRRITETEAAIGRWHTHTQHARGPK